MLDLVCNPEDTFSRNAAHFIFITFCLPEWRLLINLANSLDPDQAQRFWTQIERRALVSGSKLFDVLIASVESIKVPTAYFVKNKVFPEMKAPLP